jgi:4-amino-4-deoxy-L-arabinose transferase-like glycosyltransferase
MALPLAIVAIALAAHAHCFFGDREHTPNTDTFEYLTNAASLAAGHGFRDAAGVIETRRTPGYPLFLTPFALLGLAPRVVAATQHVLAVALVLAVYLATLRLWRRPAAAALAALLLAIDPGTIYMANLVMTETVMSIVLFAAIVVMILLARNPSARLAAIAGLLVAVAVMVRPSAMYLWIPLAVWVAVVTKKRRMIITASFVVAALALPALWTLHNFVRTGNAVLSSIAGEQLYYGRAAGVLAIERRGLHYSPLPFGGDDAFYKEFFGVVAPELAQRSLRERPAGLSFAEISAFDARLAVEILRTHPRELVEMTLAGALHFTFDSAWDYAYVLYGGLLRDALIVAMFTLSVVMFVFAAAAFRKLRRAEPNAAWLFLTFLLYSVAIYAGPEHTIWRHRVPLIPVYSMLIAASVMDRGRQAA